MQRLLFLVSLCLLVSGCFGDKKTVVEQELGDASFINKKFSGNKMGFSALPQNMCAFIKKETLQKWYPEASKMLFDDGKTFETKSCRFLIYIGNQDYDYLGGTIVAIADETSPDYNWIENWELKKKISKSSEYISGIGKAAIWNAKKRELSIKMEGYSVMITVPGSQFKNEEVAKNRDYKSIAIKLAESSGLF